MTEAKRQLELKGYPPIVRAIKILQWIDSHKSFPTAQQFQSRFGGSISTAHRMLNAVEEGRGIERPRRVNATAIRERANGSG